MLNERSFNDESKCADFIENEFYIQHLKLPISASNNYSMKTDHYHNFFEIYYLLDGQVSYLIGNRIFRVKQHDMVFINKYKLHKTKYSQKSSKDRILCYFDTGVFDYFNNNETIRNEIISLFELVKVSFPMEFNKYILETFMQRILPAYDKKNSYISNLKSKLIFSELLLSILELKKSNKIIIDSNSEFCSKEKRIYEITSYINTNYGSNITLELLSDMFFISKYYLCRIFKEITGFTVIDYINNKRLIEAQNLLKYSNLSIKEISEKVGFNNVSYFIELFKNNYNCTPKTFQETYFQHKLIG